jgi:hypothetical protein
MSLAKRNSLCVTGESLKNLVASSISHQTHPEAYFEKYTVKGTGRDFRGSKSGPKPQSSVEEAGMGRGSSCFSGPLFSRPPQRSVLFLRASQPGPVLRPPWLSRALRPHLHLTPQGLVSSGRSEASSAGCVAKPSSVHPPCPPTCSSTRTLGPTPASSVGSASTRSRT